MSTISKNDFIAGVKKSAVIDDDRLQEWLKVVEAETAQEIAAKLIRDQLLTKWQAKYLMSGRTRLDISSYRLLERIQRDELGDRFLALHTSLARKVDLQVLPSSFSKDQSRSSEFMKKASLVAKLDHPNLIHVYDIDQEGGRLFLVTEHVEGTTLEKIARTSLNEGQIARLAIQAMAGISHAHENGVIHGCITQADLVLTDEDEVKIQNLSVLPLQQLQSDSDPDPIADYVAISKISDSLLQEIPTSKRSENYATLVELFSSFQPDTANSATKLSDALTDWLKTCGESGLSDSIGVAATNPLAGGFDQPIASTGAPKQKKQTPEEPESSEPEPVQGAVGQLWKKNPVALIATVAVIVIMLIGGTAWGVLALTKDKGNSVAQNDSNLNNNGPNGSTNGGKSNGKNSLSPIESGKSTTKEDDLIGRTKELTDSLPGDPNPVILNHPPAPVEPAPTQDTPTPKPDVPVVAPAQPAIPDTTKFTSPQAKSELHLGPEKFVVPASTPLKIIRQAPDGNVEVQAIMNDNTIHTGLVKADLITDAAAAPVPTQQTTEINPAAGQPVEGSPMGNAEVPRTAPKTSPPPETAGDPKTPVPTPDVLTEISGIGPATQAVLFKSGITTFKQLAALSPDELKQTLQSVGFLRPTQKHADWIAQAKALTGDTSPVSSGGEPAEPDASGPFANFPRITQLPPVENTQEFKIADLVIKKQYLLGAEIVCEQGVSRTKLIFEMRRTPEDKQKWIVGVKRRPKETPTDIASFRKSETGFHFQWLEEAEKNKYAEFLQNCYVKLTLPEDQTALLTLREPVKIPAIRLTQDSFSDSIEFEIPGLPAPENIVIEVLKPQINGVDLDIAKSGVEKGMPGQIWLKQRDANGFLWLEVAADLRSKLKLQSNLVLLRTEQQTQVVKNNQDLAKLATLVKQAENVAVNQNLQVQASNAPAAKKDIAKKQAEAAIARTAKFAEYVDAISKMIDQPISVRIYAKFGKYQTKLAEMDLTMTNPK